MSIHMYRRRRSAVPKVQWRDVALVARPIWPVESSTSQPTQIGEWVKPVSKHELPADGKVHLPSPFFAPPQRASRQSLCALRRAGRPRPIPQRHASLLYLVSRPSSTQKDQTHPIPPDIIIILIFNYQYITNTWIIKLKKKEIQSQAPIITKPKKIKDPEELGARIPHIH